jgi:hypothetical protein
VRTTFPPISLPRVIILVIADIFAIPLSPTSHAVPKPKLSSEAIRCCAKLLRKSGTDPDTRNLTVTYYDSGADYFQPRPDDDYWNAGRRAVGKRAIHAVSFTPKHRMLGGIMVYLLEAASEKLLWTYRGK